ncbi:DNA sulfur modification protein DndB [Parendozoicomonas sp. Alg238-R29]|uniref:DNA sulfur modification protein DndB n=1 Tax=Parendozoicomonas sp. Alg238-R29 TaxID=2993446 RepID=UPI00248EBD7A|nr:DNA sulfur modification protein DndB [Parendozoicomonas sp. Alg238-R29]
MSRRQLSEFCHQFPAVRGIQAGRPCYIAMCPMRLIPKIFVFDEEEVPPELRAQRILNKSRLPALASYLVDNIEDYTLSAITASINDQVNFEPLADTGVAVNLGLLSVPMDAQILINDGQHRRAAIEEALKENSELGHDNIPVLFFIDEGLKRSQQMFADLNKHAVRPSDSLSTLYDHRDPSSLMACYIVDKVPCFKKLTEMEKSSISSRSIKLFTLSSLKLSSRSLLRKRPKDVITQEEMDLASEFWNSVCQGMPDWLAAQKREIPSSELRQNYVHSHGVALHALGCAGADLLCQYPEDWQSHLNKLDAIDWSRANVELWEGRALHHGKLSKARISVALTANVIRKTLGVRLSPEDEALEESLDQ